MNPFKVGDYVISNPNLRIDANGHDHFANSWNITNRTDPNLPVPNTVYKIIKVSASAVELEGLRGSRDISRFVLYKRVANTKLLSGGNI